MTSQPERRVDLFDGPSEMHALMRAFDWSSSVVGPPEHWPQSLRVVVRTLLASRYPMVMTWGPDFTQFYNDAYAGLIGDKHPAALGLDIRITLAEGWDTLGPIISEVMATGRASWLPALLLLLERSGYREEAYFDVSHAAAEDDNGRIVGMLAVCSEVTQQVLADRRLRLLRDLAFRASQTRSLEAACADIAAAMGEHPLDVPFALLYLPSPGGHRLALAAVVGLETGGPLSPPLAELDTEGLVWPLARAVAGEMVLVDDLPVTAGLRGGPWGEPLRTALALPVATAGQDAPQGVLVVGVSPSRALDEGYRSFFALLAGQVSAAVRNARAYEQERRRAEELALLDRAKTTFFSNVSHEFRTPLTLLLGPVADLLARAEQHTPHDVELLGIIQRNGLRLLKLVNTLLDFSRIEANRAAAVYQPTDLAALTADLASSFRSTIERAGLGYTVDCPPLSQPVVVDHDMWEKIVLNLLSNAFKFTFAGEIAVTLREVDGAAELAVRDTGVGIPEADRAQIFQRFHRVRGVRGRTHEGTGIGLALVQELVRLHGGEILVESALGQGSLFRVRVPLGTRHLPAERPAEAPPPAPLAAEAFLAEAARWQAMTPEETGTLDQPPLSAPSELAQARILLADDNADMRDYIRRLLADDYLVEDMADGALALRAAQEHPPDLVVSDVMMPGLDGFALLRALRTDPRTASVPVILLSARAGEEATVEGLDAGADDYLVKPFSARELRARVRANLELARMRRLIVEEQAARAAAEQALHERDQFLTLAAHELKTPLTSLQGYAEILDRRWRDDQRISERERRAVSVIVSQTRRFGRLVALLLDLSRIQIGQLTIEQALVDADQLVGRVVAEAQPALVSHTITLEPADEPLMMLGDALRLEQSLHNLLQNAVKYSPVGGVIHVRVLRRDGMACVEVADQGLGIPPEDLPRVFQRFYRAPNVRGDQISGLGIGLFVVQEIVERHGGSITVRSDLGQGSVFTLCLPLREG
ncbi:MAG: hypothetical protein OHK0022_48600 [Roseiflexaceae bacterium]